MKYRHAIVHVILFAVTLAFAIVCFLLIPQVNVNSDMTKYLPDNSPMRKGVDIVNAEFATNMVSSADVHVMEHARFDSTLYAQLNNLEHVQSIAYRISRDSAYTVYDLVVAKSVDQKALGQKIVAQYPEKELLVETSQDGATPPLSALLIAGIIILLILLIMTESWLDPLICLVVTGIAVVINIGTNAWLPSVSITTNYIVAILQLVLSLDYSIILMNRWRQERETAGTEVLAVNRALRKAWKPILSSALTTIVGLLMLGFMRLKIGLDLGFVLAKGVVCSLVCTITILPTLILLCYRAILATRKSAPLIPTDGIGRFATNHKVSMAIFAIVMALGSYYLAQKTEISFSTKGESQIEKIFPATNPIVLVYPTAEEQKVLLFADTLDEEFHVYDNQWVIFSYPTILLPQLTATELYNYIKYTANLVPNMSAAPNESSFEVMENKMYDPQMMQMLYYMHSGQADTLHIGFMELINFIRFGLINDPKFVDLIDDDIRAQIELLNEAIEAVLTQDNEIVRPDTTPIPRVEIPLAAAQPIDAAHALATATPKVVERPVTEEPTEEKQKRRNKEQIPVPTPPQPMQQDTPKTITRTITVIEKVDTEHIPVIGFTALLNKTFKTPETQYLVNILDTAVLERELPAEEMGKLIGSSKSQTKMIYSMSSSGKSMTPIGYVHFLTDDLFKRPALQSFVKPAEKAQLTARKDLMDVALQRGTLTPEQLSEKLALCQIDLTPLDIRTLWASTAKVYTREITETIEPDAATASQPVVVETDEPVQVIEVEKPVVAYKPIVSKPKQRRKTQEEQRLELFETLIHSQKSYSAAEMLKILNKLEQNIDSSQVQLLYVAYGSSQGYGDSLTMSPAEVLTYVSDTVLKNEGIAPFLDSTVVHYIDSVSQILQDGLKQIRHEQYSIMAILTNLPDESPETYRFVQRMEELSAEIFSEPAYLVGESVMYDEMKEGFDKELHLVTILTILAIFLIVAITFKSLVVPIILVLTVMTAVYTYATFAGLVHGHMLYLAYLVTQSILMGATIDYGILYANYYKELRRMYDKYEAAREAYKGSIRTILTSGSIMVAGPGAMAFLVDDVTISAIVSGISIGAFISILLILFALPAILVAFDRFVVDNKKSV